MRGRSFASDSQATAMLRTWLCLLSPSESHGAPEPARRVLTSQKTSVSSSATTRSSSPKRVRWLRAITS